MLTFRGLLCCWRPSAPGASCSTAKQPPRFSELTGTCNLRTPGWTGWATRSNKAAINVQQQSKNSSSRSPSQRRPASHLLFQSPFFPRQHYRRTLTQMRTHISDEELQGSIGDGDPVVGARPPPQFVQDDQWAFSCPGDDLWGFGQLLHERTAAFVDVVRGSHPDDRDRQRQKVSNIHERRWTCSPFLYHTL